MRTSQTLPLYSGKKLLSRLHSSKTVFSSNEMVACLSTDDIPMHCTSLARSRSPCCLSLLPCITSIRRSMYSSLGTYEASGNGGSESHRPTSDSSRLSALWRASAKKKELGSGSGRRARETSCEGSAGIRGVSEPWRPCSFL